MNSPSLREETKKIVILRGSSQYVSPASYNVQEIGLGKVLSQRNWDVTILSSGPKERTIEYGNHLRWIELTRRGGKFGWLESSLSIFKSIDMDLIQIQDLANLSTYVGHFSSLRRKVPLILSLGEYFPKSRVKSMVNGVISYSIKKNIKGVLCKTNSAKEYARSLNFPHLHYAPIGIDSSVYDTVALLENKTYLQIRLMREQGKKLLCHIGRLDKEDNIDFIFAVLELLGDDYALVLVGEPRQYAENHEKYNYLSSRIILTGQIANQNISSVLAESDLYIACSRYEIFGMSAAESIYHGCPVIGYATGGISEIILDMKNGLLMDNRNPSDWENKIRMIFNSEIIGILQSGCKETGRELTWEYRANKYEAVYHDVLHAVGR